LTPSHERPVRPGRTESAGEPLTWDKRPKGGAGSLSESICVGSRSWLPWLPRAGEGLPTSTKINDDFMSLEIDGRVIATAQFREHAAADGRGAWIVSCHPGRLFTRNQAITAMVLAERLAAGYGDDDLFVIGWREEPSL
jgi:hypothetical protein